MALGKKTREIPQSEDHPEDRKAEEHAVKVDSRNDDNDPRVGRGRRIAPSIRRDENQELIKDDN